MSTNRNNPAPVKVICLGLGRTGTSSLRDALDRLGFGPCYHMSVIIQEGGKDLPLWCKIGDGNGTLDNLDTLFHGYSSVLDYPASMYPAEMFAAYPDAKFILTTRDPSKWEKSMKETILSRPPTPGPNKSGLRKALTHWKETYMRDKYHRGLLDTHAQQEFLDHTQRVKRIIPADQLLVYEVSEGWDKLVDFLGVPQPTEPFPHVNDTAQFKEFVRRFVGNTGEIKEE